LIGRVFFIGFCQPAPYPLAGDAKTATIQVIFPAAPSTSFCFTDAFQPITCMGLSLLLKLFDLLLTALFFHFRGPLAFDTYQKSIALATAALAS